MGCRGRRCGNRFVGAVMRGRADGGASAASLGPLALGARFCIVGMLFAACLVQGTPRTSQEADLELLDLGQLSISAWTSAAFARLPCFERASWHGRGRLVMEGGLEATDHAAFHHAIVTWDSVEDLLVQAAAGVTRDMAAEGAWFLEEPALAGATLATDHLVSALGDLDSTAVKPPFVQRVEVGGESARVYVWGDLHGSLHSFLRHLALLRQRGDLGDDWALKPGVRLVFLGDYVDRGPYGVEVIATALRLRLANPGAVHMARGNHEDEGINRGSTFWGELVGKYPSTSRLRLRRVFGWYATLPQALFLAAPGGGSAARNTSYLLACHGGIELGHDPQPFLAAALPSQGGPAFSVLPHLQRQAWLTLVPPAVAQGVPAPLRRLFEAPSSSHRTLSEPWAVWNVSSAAVGAQGQVQPGAAAWPTRPTQSRIPHGYMWTDFFVDDAETVLGYTPGRGPILGKPLTEWWLERAGVTAILRGHQHNNNPAAGPMLQRLQRHRGLYDNWDGAGLVYTFLSAAETGVLGFNAASVGVLQWSAEQAACSAPPPTQQPPNEYAKQALLPGASLWHCHGHVPVQRVQVAGGWRRATRPLSVPAQDGGPAATQDNATQVGCLGGEPWQEVRWGPLPLVEDGWQAGVTHACEVWPLPDTTGPQDAPPPSSQCDRIRG